MKRGSSPKIETISEPDNDIGRNQAYLTGTRSEEKIKITVFNNILSSCFFSGSLLSLFFTYVSEQQKTKYLKHTANSRG